MRRINRRSSTVTLGSYGAGPDLLIFLTPGWLPLPAPPVHKAGAASCPWARVQPGAGTRGLSCLPRRVGPPAAASTKEQGQKPKAGQALERIPQNHLGLGCEGKAELNLQISSWESGRGPQGPSTVNRVRLRMETTGKAECQDRQGPGKGQECSRWSSEDRTSRKVLLKALAPLPLEAGAPSSVWLSLRCTAQAPSEGGLATKLRAVFQPTCQLFGVYSETEPGRDIKTWLSQSHIELWGVCVIVWLLPLPHAASSPNSIQRLFPQNPLCNSDLFHDDTWSPVCLPHLLGPPLMTGPRQRCASAHSYGSMRVHVPSQLGDGSR